MIVHANIHFSQIAWLIKAGRGKHKVFKERKGKGR